MKRIPTAALLLCAAQLAAAKNEQKEDTLQWTKLNEVVVTAAQAPKNAPFAVSRIGKAEMEQFAATGKSLPYLLSRTPGVISWSDNGMGTGTTYLRIRGAGDNRINVTLNGVSLNSPDDQCVYWANTIGYASLLGSATVQRGVGSSSNGDGAFGGTIALSTQPISEGDGLNLDRATLSWGSHNTWHGGLRLTGIHKKQWSAEAAWSQTSTRGFIDGTASRGGSYLAGVGYTSKDKHTHINFRHLGNYELTGQAWNGVVAGDDNMSLNMTHGVKTYEDMYRLGLGRYNNLCESLVQNEFGHWQTKPYAMQPDGSLWGRTTDHFYQGHNLLSLSYLATDQWTLMGTLHYTFGHGNYHEFRPANKLAKFGLSDLPLADGSTLSRTDFARRKSLSQDTYGIVTHANYVQGAWKMFLSASAQRYDGDHWGDLTYAANAELANKINLAQNDYRYYKSQSSKTDVQLSAKASRLLGHGLEAFVDVQYRHVALASTGNDDKFDLTYNRLLPRKLNIHRRYNFFNPKAGLSWTKNHHRAYASYALGQREPERRSFIDNGNYPLPKPESVHDFEAGYSLSARRFHLGANLYAMLYRHQLMQTGALSDIGTPITTNVPRSQRLGIELEAGVKVCRWLRLETNAALSRNRIFDFDEEVESYDNLWYSLQPTKIHYHNTRMAFSPWAIVNGFADFQPCRNLKATWHTLFVSRQYLDNTSSLERSLPRYTQTNIQVSYAITESLRASVDFYNIFNRHYAASGWVYSAIVGDTHPNSSRYHQIGYNPAAGFTTMASIVYDF